MSRNQARLIFWSPRILCIAFAFFLSLFALDVSDEGHGFWRTALALLIHLIPTAIVGAILVVAWRWEWAGAILFTAAAAFYGVPRLAAHPSWVLAISGPPLVVAGLFLLNWIKRSELRTTR